jgi:hypothetical protein
VRRGAASFQSVPGSCPAVGSRPRSRCRHRGAVLGGRGFPGAVTRARSGRPAGGRRSRGMSGRRPAGHCPVRVPGPAVEMSVRPTGRADVQRPRIQRPVSSRPVSRCPDGQACGVHGAGAALSPAGPGVAPPFGWVQPVDVPRGPRAAWSPAGIGPDGQAMVRRWPWLARMRVDPRPGRPRGRHPGYGTARRWPTTNAVEGQGADRVAGSPGPSRCSSAREASWGRWPAMGLDQEVVVTTLGGRWAGGDPGSSSSAGPMRFGGEQPAAALRPRWVRSAVG